MESALDPGKATVQLAPQLGETQIHLDAQRLEVGDRGDQHGGLPAVEAHCLQGFKGIVFLFHICPGEVLGLPLGRRPSFFCRGNR